MLLQNLSKLLDDPRRRSVILVTFLVLLTMTFVGGIRLFHEVRGKRLPRGASIESIQSRQAPKGARKLSTQAYAKLQIEHNKKKAQEAKKRGRSSIATIVDSFNLEQQKSLPHEENASGYGRLPVFASEAEQAINNHQAFMAQQQTDLTKQQMQGAIHQQMSQLFNVWGQTPTQTFEKSILEDSQYAKLKGDSTSNLGPPLVKAGTILQATLLTEINSDEPSPVLAQITTGEFKEARLIGTLSRTGERLLIQFHTLDLPRHSRTLSIQALGVDVNTARTSLASHVDRHTLLRYGSFFAASFLQGFGMQMQKEVVQPTEEVQRRNFSLLKLDMPLLSAAANVGTQFSSELAKQLHTPPTVCVHAGAAVGILFTTDLSDPSYSSV